MVAPLETGRRRHSGQVHGVPVRVVFSAFNVSDLQKTYLPTVRNPSNINVYKVRTFSCPFPESEPDLAVGACSSPPHLFPEGIRTQHFAQTAGPLSHQEFAQHSWL